ncbi:hypothetical protein XENORESO_020393 [Xenotaenia resolanae]|uniref:Uncharacterized protein n=1 Tax=Xenotaenia resolanae TaxID=208358 RepID=A0ABV0X8I5_9TELE
MGCLITCLPQLVCMHGLPVSPLLFYGSQRSPVLVMLYDQYTLYPQTSMTPTNASSDPFPFFPCRLSLSFIQSHPSGFHLVFLFGRVVALKDTRKLFISCSPSPCLGLSFIFSSYP